jgi:hypothetical protein
MAVASRRVKIQLVPSYRFLNRFKIFLEGVSRFKIGLGSIGGGWQSASQNNIILRSAYRGFLTKQDQRRGCNYLVTSQRAFRGQTIRPAALFILGIHLKKSYFFARGAYLARSIVVNKC